MPARSSRLPRRTRSGQISRAVAHAIDAHSPAAVKRLMDASLRGMAAPEWGTELGRLLLAKKITPEQHEAGRRWARLRHEIVRTLDLPPISPRLMRAFGTSAWQPSDAYEHSLLAILQAASQALGVSQEAEGMVVATCEHDRACVTADDLKYLQLGLDALATHWHLT